MRIGIVIPAHNEAMTIAKCLASVQSAIDQLPSTIKAYPLVVLDSCTDDTQKLVKATGVDYLCCNYHCVGQVRDIGIRYAIENGATWLACTDADSVVPMDWLVQQIEHIIYQPTDMICGVVDIDSWAHLTPQTREDYIAHYQDRMGHRHIHGANLSFNSEAYLAVDGFTHLPCHEDVDLVKKFEDQGYAITWSNRVRVLTSSRLKARATEGFAVFLANLENNNLY
ncbi:MULTISPECIES: glycosyltransferase [Psychrobacter]|jgi:glycosyltransferase involved in cell wall biosynthesis|uniref:glycosyltransferase n=1 Tax=Psychrobacter TaxID=497 RepID=UPI000C33E529|nr:MULTISPECIES: glycosyltransferase [Psychrobacter]PKG35490.1 glycosyl transferase [Psychrobacter sp. Sarcosine-3u-12]